MVNRESIIRMIDEQNISDNIKNRMKRAISAYTRAHKMRIVAYVLAVVLIFICAACAAVKYYDTLPPLILAAGICLIWAGKLSSNCKAAVQQISAARIAATEEMKGGGKR